MAKAKQQPGKNQVKTRLATVELALAKLTEDFKATTYRQNELIADCIKNATDELQTAFKSLFSGNLQESFDLAGVAWLYADFGRQILEAEAIEHILGESDYIELSEISIPWEGKATDLLCQLEQSILQLRADIEKLAAGESAI
ncbi:MAG: hypothetical protein WCT03_04615 [Candidatus Obscuribacterales bacterium]